MNVLYLIGKIRAAAFRHLEEAMRARGIPDISPAHGDVLFIIARREPVEMGEIGRLTGRGKSTVTGIINYLERLQENLAADRH